MKKLKLYFVLFSLIFLFGCVQTTALLGPGYTVITSGNLLQAGLQYGANSAFKKEHGEYPLTYMKKQVEKKNNQKKLHVKLKNFIETKVKTTKKKLTLN